MSTWKSASEQSPFLERESLYGPPEDDLAYELRGIESPFQAREELEDEASTAGAPELLTFTAKTLPVRVSVLVTRAARRASRVEVLLFAHGLDVCGPIRKPRPETFITERPLRLGELVEASGRPIVLIVPFLDWEHLRQNDMGFGEKWHKLARPANLNAVVAEALERVATLTGAGTAPTVLRLIMAGHSRAFGVFDAMARACKDPEMANGALARLSNVWALDSTYTSPVADWMAWLRSRDDLNITVIYRHGSYVSKKTNTTVALSTGIHGKHFLDRGPKSGGRLTVIPVPAGKVGHCAIPVKYLPDLLATLPKAAADMTNESYLDEAEDLEFEREGSHDFAEVEALEDEETGEPYSEAEAWYAEPREIDFVDEEEASLESFAALAEPEEEEEDAFAEPDEVDLEEEGVSYDEETYGGDEAREGEVLESSGLTPAELKAVHITSAFETGRRGGFSGLSGNFDGQGLSFGLVNWTIGTGSLQPLLRDFAQSEPRRWSEIFGPHAAAFLALLSRKGAVREQHRFAIEEMNVSRIVEGKRDWSVKEPWRTYFLRLSEEPAFQGIQVRYVRDLLERARYFCEYFALKSEMAFAFMFDAVSSHGKWWLTKQGKDGVQMRRELLRARLQKLQATHGKGNVPEKELLFAIADVLAETSAARWRDNVRRRKRWFVTGDHPRAGELKGLQPRPDLPYHTSGAASGSPVGTAQPVKTPAPVTTSPPRTTAPTRPSSMSDAERAKLIAAALHQGKTAGAPEDRAAIAATLKENGTDTATWFAEMVPDATFLGRRIRASGGTAPGVHRALFEVLQRAERTLLDKYPGRTAEQLGREMGIYDIAGLRPPKKATGGSLPSYHCFGLAIDINHDTNPFVGNMKPKKDSPRYEEFLANRSPRIIERAMWLLRGERFNVETPLAASGAGAAWDIHHRASETLAEYLRLADDIDGQRLRDLVAGAQGRGDTKDPAWWKRRITADRSMIRHWDFQHHKHPEKAGYMDFPRDLVVALAGAGLLWGGLYRGAKDIMHFDLREGPIRHRPKRGVEKATTPAYGREGEYERPEGEWPEAFGELPPEV